MLTLLIGIIFLVFVLLVTKWWWDGRGKKLPPGPWGLPVIGHLTRLGRNPHKTLMKWKEIYGPIIYCRFGSYPTVVLGDAKLIKQAFSIPEFSERQEFQQMVEATNKKGIIFGEGAPGVEQRRFAMKNLKSFGMGSKSIEGKIQEDVRRFLEKMKEEEGQLISNKHLLNAYISSSLWSIVMTEKLEPQDFWRLTKIADDQVVHLGSTICQLAFFMPWIENLVRKLSFGTYSVIKERVRAYQEIFRFMKVNIEKRRLTWVTNKPRDITDAYLDKMAETTDSSSSFHKIHDMSSEFMGDLFMAGTESTSTTLEWSLNYMARYPLVQRKLQEELDQVLGAHHDDDRFPSLADRPALPYADAVVHEILRLSTVAPFGAPHRTTANVDFQGYTIPKGTTVIGNLYAAHYDPIVWGDPQAFRPSRFLGDEGKKLKAERLIPFGVGRRSCVGEMMAKDQIFLYLTGIFQRFNVRFLDPCDPPIVNDVLGFALIPTEFQVIFESRFVSH